MEMFIHQHTWKRPTQRAGLRISTACEHRTRQARLSANYRLPTWTLLYIHSGACLHSTAVDAECALQASGTVLLHRPNADRYEHRVGNGIMHAAYLLFHDAKPSELDRFCRTSTGWAIFRDDADHSLWKMMQSCAAVAYAQGERGYWQAQSQLCGVLDAITSAVALDDGTYQVAYSGTPSDDAIRPLADRVDALLHASIDRPLTLNDLADAMGVSVSTLTHRYTEATGASPMATFVSKRIERIQSLLRMGHPVKLIARQMHFADSAALSGFFKRHTGLSPRDFLHRQRR
jgi:AraC-like DNA-binding protein